MKQTQCIDFNVHLLFDERRNVLCVNRDGCIALRQSLFSVDDRRTTVCCAVRVVQRDHYVLGFQLNLHRKRPSCDQRVQVRRMRLYIVNKDLHLVCCVVSALDVLGYVVLERCY